MIVIINSFFVGVFSIVGAVMLDDKFNWGLQWWAYLIIFFMSYLIIRKMLAATRMINHITCVVVSILDAIFVAHYAIRGFLDKFAVNSTLGLENNLFIRFIFFTFFAIFFLSWFMHSNVLGYMKDEYIKANNTSSDRRYKKIFKEMKAKNYIKD